MSRTMLEEDAALPADKSQLDIIGDVAGLAYLAGSDTTVAAVHSLFLAMLVYPEVQAKAQAEIDRIVGKDRLPELEDRRDMPYVESVVNECLRWHAVAPMGQSRFLFRTHLTIHITQPCPIRPLRMTNTRDILSRRVLSSLVPSGALNARQR
jgi:hypothetical protein